jgi:hypothetical protein
VVLKAGAIVLSIWSGVNLLLAGAILVSMTMLGRNAPGLRILFDEAAVRGLDPRALAVNAIAVLFNACAFALCILLLYVTWSGVAVGVKSAFWALVVSAGLLQVFGFRCDAYLWEGVIFLRMPFRRPSFLSVSACRDLGRTVVGGRSMCVQRTRSSPSARREPLTRCPLGRQGGSCGRP